MCKYCENGKEHPNVKMTIEMEDGHKENHEGQMVFGVTVSDADSTAEVSVFMGGSGTSHMVMAGTQALMTAAIVNLSTQWEHPIDEAAMLVHKVFELALAGAVRELVEKHPNVIIDSMPNIMEQLKKTGERRGNNNTVRH